MSTLTTNLSLVKPALTDTADITAINTNMDLIDTAIAAKASSIYLTSLQGVASPLMNGTATVGVSTLYSRQDHIHAGDTSKANLISPALTGTPTAPTASQNINTMQIATTAFVLGQAATVTPLMNGVASIGTSTLYSRQDHIHASDTTKANLANPTFTGIATLPTNSVSDSLLISLNSSVIANGTTQATATILTKDENIVTSGTGGVQVQGATTGKVVVIINKTVSAINIYPASGHYFDGLAINIPISLPANAFIELYGFSSTQWNSTINAVTNALNTIIADAGNIMTATNTETALQELANNSIYQTATGTATAILVATAPLINGYATTFIASVSNAGAATTINGKPLYKPSTVIAPNLIVGKAYTVWYNLSGVCFFIKASASGTAVVANVLAGTTFGSDTDSDLVGTMSNNGTLSYTPSASIQTIPLGYTTGGTVAAVSFTAANVLTGTTIAGTAGTMANNASPTTTIATQGGTKVIPAGYNPGGTVTATFPVHTNALGTQYSAGTAGQISIFPPTGYWDTSQITYLTDANYAAANIVSGLSIFGLAGTATIASLGGRRYASGTLTTSGTKIGTVTGLTFQATTILISQYSSYYYYYYLSGSGLLGTGTVNGSYTMSTNATGFTFTTYYANVSTTWVAYE